MAKNDNLKDFVTDVANAIRAKKGTTDLINPQDFAAEISTISGGSGEGGGGGSTIEYLDVSEVDESTMLQVSLYAHAVKGRLPNFGIVAGFPITGYLTFQGQLEDVVACAIDSSLEMSLKDPMGSGATVTINIVEFMKQNGTDVDSIPHITKEQFYSID